MPKSGIEGAQDLNDSERGTFWLAFEQVNFLLRPSSVQTAERYLGTQQEIAVKEDLG